MIYLLDTDHVSLDQRRNATLVTRNSRDFGQVPGLIIVDWSLPES